MVNKKDRDAMKKAAEEEAKNSKTIEEKIEEERAALKADGLTPVTKDTFAAWKERRAKEKQALLEDQVKKAEEDKALKKAATKGKNSIMNGRALFTYNPELFQDDENAAGAAELEVVEDEEEKEQVDEALFAQEQVNEDEEVDFD